MDRCPASAEAVIGATASRTSERSAGTPASPPLCRSHAPIPLTLLSARTGNYQFHPYYDVLIDQLWVSLGAGLCG